MKMLGERMQESELSLKTLRSSLIWRISLMQDDGFREKWRTIARVSEHIFAKASLKNDFQESVFVLFMAFSNQDIPLSEYRRLVRLYERLDDLISDFSEFKDLWHLDTLGLRLDRKSSGKIKSILGVLEKSVNPNLKKTKVRVVYSELLTLEKKLIPLFKKDIPHFSFPYEGQLREGAASRINSPVKYMIAILQMLDFRISEEILVRALKREQKKSTKGFLDLKSYSGVRTMIGSHTDIYLKLLT
jgi:hypothetical protein